MSEDLPPNRSKTDEIADALASMADGVADRSERRGRLSDHAASDDRLSAPAVDSSMLAHPRGNSKPRANQSLEARRTFIPILLMLGVLLPAMGSLRWILGRESAFAAVPPWLALSLVLVGPILLVLAIANMLHVRRLLRNAA